MFNKPTFYNDCEHWRLRCTAGNELKDIYDGKIWNSFLSFQDEPFLSEPGNLAFILNFDFFQPYEHVSCSVGAIYMSILNLPREHRYKCENILLVGLIPGPHEPQRSINTFIKPLVNDLLKFWDGIEMYIASSNCRKVIRCAVLCVACDLPAGRSFVVF